MRSRVRVHQAELRSRQVPRSLPATGEPTASYEATASSLLSLTRPRPATGSSLRALPGRGGVSRGCRFLRRAGRRRRSGTRVRPADRASRSWRQDASFPRECGPEAARVAPAPVAGSAVATSQPLLLPTWANGANGAQRTTCEQSAVMRAYRAITRWSISCDAGCQPRPDLPLP